MNGNFSVPFFDAVFRVAVFADCHLPVESGHPAFEGFLRDFELVAAQSERVVFLGDVFRVWAAVPGFDHENGRRLLDRIRSVSEGCRVLMVEGNWDFFIRRGFSDFFDEVSEDALALTFGGERLVFVHGHLDHLFSDRLFIRCLKSGVCYHLFRRKWFAAGPGRKLNRVFQDGELSKAVSQGELLAVAKRLERRFPRADRIVAGHFHRSFSAGKVVFVPDYFSTGMFLGFSDDDSFIYRVENNQVVPVDCH